MPFAKGETRWVRRLVESSTAAFWYARPLSQPLWRGQRQGQPIGFDQAESDRGAGLLRNELRCCAYERQVSVRSRNANSRIDRLPRENAYSQQRAIGVCAVLLL